MQIEVIHQEDAYRIAGQHYNPPTIREDIDIERFQEEFITVHRTFLAELATLGNEGSDYSRSDFAIRPSPKGITPLDRRISLTILSRQFLFSPYLCHIVRSLDLIKADYLVRIDQDAEVEWLLKIFLDKQRARVFCENERYLRFIKASLPG
jgi:hypothetical protein